MKKIFSLLAAVLFAGSMMAANLLSIDFTQGQGEWTIDNKELGGLEFVWAQSAQYGMKATGYVGGANHATESWLVSPLFSLTDAESATFAFSHARRYGDLSQLHVYATAAAAEGWTELSVSAWPDGSNWNYIDATADLSAYAGMADVQVAFAYTSTATAGATWEIKTANVTTDGSTPEPPVGGADVEFTSAEFSGQGTSGTGSLVTATKNGVTFTCDKAYGDQYGVRCYKNSVVTITSSTQMIDKIAFEFATVSGTLYNGGLETEIVVNNESWSATMASQARMNKIQIYFGNQEVPDTITVAEAIAIADTLADNNTSEVRYYVEGYAVNVEDMSLYHDQSFYLVDNVAAPDSLFKVYRAVPKKDGVAYPVLNGDKLRVLGSLKKYKMDEQTPALLELVEPEVEFLQEVEGDRTVAELPVDTITVARALEIGSALAEGGVTELEYVVKGYVSKIETYFDSTYLNETFWITDESGSTAASMADGAFYIYRGKPNTGAEIGLDALITIRCKIKKFNKNGTIIIENEKAGPVEVLEEGYVEVPESISVADALAIGLALDSGAVTEERYEITGYVSSIKESFSDQYKNETFWITDTKGSYAASTADGAFYIYRGKPNTGAEIGLDAKIKIICNIKNYNGTIENDGSNIAFEVLEQGADRQKDTITVARALEIGQALDSAGISEKEYVIKGYVSNIVSYYDTIYKNETFWITDVEGSRAASNAEGAFEVYRGKPNTQAEIGLNAYVYVTAKIQNYKGNTIETSGTPAVEVITPGLIDTIESINVARALEIGLALDSGAVTDFRYEITGYVSSIVEKYSEQYKNETFWITDDPNSRANTTAKGAFEVYRGKPNTNAEIGLHAKIKIVCKIKNFKGTIENDGLNIVFEVLEQGIEEKLDTITVAQALEIGGALAADEITEIEYVIGGYVSNIVSYYDTIYKNETFWITDVEGSRAASNAEGAFEVYRGKPNTQAEIGLNAYVYVTAKIQNYKGNTIETSGTPAVEVVTPGIEETIEAISVARAVEIGLALESGAVTDNRYEITGYVSSIDEPFSSYGNETFWITDDSTSTAASAAKGAFEVYRGKPNTNAEIGMHAKIKIVCKIKNYKGTIENDGMNIVFEVLKQGEELTYDTIDVATAMEIGMALADNTTSELAYVIKGFAVKAYAPDSGKVAQNFFMADDPAEYGEFEAYACTPDYLVETGDYVMVTGKIQKYVSGTKTQIEVSYGKAVHAEAPELVTITVEKAIEIGMTLEAGAETEKKYHVKGYVINASAYNEDNEFQNFFMADDPAATSSNFQAYRAKLPAPGVSNGQEIILTGKITKFVGQSGDPIIQIAQGTVEGMEEGLENVMLTEQAQKLMLNGVLYIIRDNKMYNVQGIRVR